MRSLGIFILMLGLIIQVLSSSLIVLNYEVNTSYIIENFCENTDKPELECNGKCHLNKQIKQDTENKEEAPATTNETLTLVLATQEIQSFEFNFADSELNLRNSLYLEGNYSNHLQSIFHPPQV